jgi:hypothetical protein
MPSTVEKRRCHTRRRSERAEEAETGEKGVVGVESADALSFRALIKDGSDVADGLKTWGELQTCELGWAGGKKSSGTREWEETYEVEGCFGAIDDDDGSCEEDGDCVR